MHAAVARVNRTILMEEMLEIFMKLGRMKGEQIKRPLPLDYVAVACARCKAQLPLMLRHYGMKSVRLAE